MATRIDCAFVRVSQHGKPFYLTTLTAGDLVYLSYVARRGVDIEEGAVQRLLNPTRINSIRDFVLNEGVFPTSIVLNWTEKHHSIKTSSTRLILARTRNAAQIIDGQHRVMGLAAAIEKRPSIKSMLLPVSIYDGLDTKDCADIFLAINTEQKPVARSLVFDLYRVASSYIVDPATVRAGDVAKELNEHPESPFAGFIKFPGAPASQKGLALSTVVSAIKPLIEEKGAFEQVGLTELQMQTQFLINFFGALRDGYGIEWESKTNVFRTALGFVGAIEFVKNKLIVHCNLHSDFTSKAIKKVLPIEAGNLIRTQSVEGMQGRRASTKVAEELEAIFDPGEHGGKPRKIKV
jgi:DNA sulfur modification protein DndB